MPWVVESPSESAGDEARRLAATLSSHLEDYAAAWSVLSARLPARFPTRRGVPVPTGQSPGAGHAGRRAATATPQRTAIQAPA